MLQLLHACGERLLPGSFGRLSGIMTSLVFETSFAVGILSEFISKASNAGRAKDIRVDAVLLKALAR